MSKLLEMALNARAELLKPATDIIDKAEAEGRDLSPAEWDTVKAHNDDPEVKKQAADLDQRIALLRAQEARKAENRATVPAGGAVVRSEPMTYARHNRRTSYFRDLGLAYVGNDPVARDRLARHRREMEIELPRAESKLRRLVLGDDAAGRDAVQELGGSMERRDISRTDGAGGEFVPPLWIMEEFAEYARAGRVTANLLRNIPLPGGTDSISIPKITGGTATGVQTADNGAVTETDMTTGSATGPVRTIAGQQDIALQLLEQSPLMFDEIVFADLAADYNAKLDVQVLNGSGSSGQHTGFFAVSGSTSTAYTDASPTVPEFWPSGAKAISTTSTARKMNLNGFIMHPRRWYWMVGTLDSNNRPYVVPTGAGPYLSLATIDGAAGGLAEGPVGTWHGLPVWLDQNVPVLFTAGAGAAGTEDGVLVLRFSDHLLFEGAMRMRALPEVLSGTLTVRLQAYAYSAFICDRFPAGIGKIVGTGLAAPSGY